MFTKSSYNPNVSWSFCGLWEMDWIILMALVNPKPQKDTCGSLVTSALLAPLIPSYCDVVDCTCASQTQICNSSWSSKMTHSHKKHQWKFWLHWCFSKGGRIFNIYHMVEHNLQIPYWNFLPFKVFFSPLSLEGIFLLAYSHAWISTNCFPQISSSSLLCTTVYFSLALWFKFFS